MVNRGFVPEGRQGSGDARAGGQIARPSRDRRRAALAGEPRACSRPADDPADNLWFAARSRPRWRPPRGSTGRAVLCRAGGAACRRAGCRGRASCGHTSPTTTWGTRSPGTGWRLLGRRFRRLGGPPPARRPVRNVTGGPPSRLRFSCARAIFRLVSAPAAVSAAGRKSRYFNGLFRRGTGSLPGDSGCYHPAASLKDRIGALRLHPGRGPAARLRRRHARGSRPRRRPLCAGDLAAARRARRSRALPAGPTPRSPSR